MKHWFTDLDTSTVDPERAVIHVVEFLVWWHQAGRRFYGWGMREEDEGLCSLAEDAVESVGGLANALRVIRSEHRSHQPAADSAEILALAESISATRDKTSSSSS